MAKIIDLTGQIFGRLTVTKFAGMSKWNNAMWECRCECGTVRIYKAGDLRRKNGTPTRSCGCLKLDNMRKSYGESNFNRLYRMYKKGANRRNHQFSLSLEEFKFITSQNCFYCGESPSQVIKDKNSHGEYIYNGIDRLDSNHGYFVENCVPCCIACNIAKHDFDYSYFKQHIKNMYHHWAKF